MLNKFSFEFEYFNCLINELYKQFNSIKFKNCLMSCSDV